MRQNLLTFPRVWWRRRRGAAQSPMQMFTLLRQPAPETLEISKAAEVFEMTLHLIKAKASRRHERAITVTGEVLFQFSSAAKSALQ